MKYSADDIIINKNPELQQLSNGKWKQVWDIVLKKTISETINLKDISKKLSHEDFDFDVQVQITKGKYLKVCVTLSRDTNPYHHDHSIFAIYRMFENLEQLLGSIDTIQGQKTEDRWSPYRKTKRTQKS
ncbi:MAG: hypothetical protein AB4426_29295 [Xenococcaceae cyanobacterium]